MNYNKDFIPAIEVINEFNKKGTIPFNIMISRNNEIFYSYKINITNDIKESYYVVKKLILTLMWMVGGNHLFLNGSKELFNYIKKQEIEDEELIASIDSLNKIFSDKFEINYEDDESKFICKDKIIELAGNFKGNRIGFDAGGSDRKVSAVIDGKVVYSEEVLWTPKVEKDYHYHLNGILDSFNKAASYLPSVDAIGISTAGIVEDNKLLQQALFFALSDEDKEKYAKNIYIDIVNKYYPNAKMIVANDGDVSAIAGSMLLKEDNILGIAMGTSEASGYCYNQNKISCRFNELGKVPIDYNKNAIKHYNVKTVGSGSNYLSQNGIINLAKMIGYEFEGSLAMQLKSIQNEANNNNEKILKAYEDMGEYLGSAIALYALFYKINKVLLLGRVMSGNGGTVLLKKANEYLKKFSHCQNISIVTPDENFKRLGQSYIAASLPKI